MALQPRTILGPYEIDVPLDRTITIKVLPEYVPADPDLKQRFKRKARTAVRLRPTHRFDQSQTELCRRGTEPLSATP